jgi:hypothetical protein
MYEGIKMYFFWQVRKFSEFVDGKYNVYSCQSEVDERSGAWVRVMFMFFGQVSGGFIVLR